MKAYLPLPYRKINGRNYEKAGVPLIFNGEIYHQKSRLRQCFPLLKKVWVFF
jgi:hypothetical protein